MAQASPEKLIERLASGKPVPAIVLQGTDVYLRDLCRNRIVDAYVPEELRGWALVAGCRRRGTGALWFL